MQQELYAEQGAMASVLGQLEQLARASPPAICRPAQQLVLMDGADTVVAAQIADICGAAAEADMDEYIARNCSGRSRPAKIAWLDATPSILDRDTLVLVSVHPLRIWKINVVSKVITIKTAQEEVRLLMITLIV